MKDWGALRVSDNLLQNAFRHGEQGQKCSNYALKWRLSTASNLPQARLSETRNAPKDCETACFVLCARKACTFSVLEDLNAESVHLAATIKRNFEELEV